MAHSIQIDHTPLTAAPLGQRLTFTEADSSRLALKLMEMGCLPGMQVEKVRAAIGRGPIALKIYPNGNLLALRYEEAAQIWVK